MSRDLAQRIVPVGLVSRLAARFLGARKGARLAYHSHRLGFAAHADSWADVVALVHAQGIAVLSVDVFDTVNQRSVMGDDNVERLVCHRVAEDTDWCGSADEFYAARQAAKKGSPLGPVQHWYQAMGLADPAEAARIESDFERSVATPVPGALAGMAELRQSGVKICFTSDMHLDQASLRTLLVHLGAFEPEDELFVSCEFGQSKFEGGLYEIVCNKFSGLSIAHVGNHKYADASVPHLFGIKPIFLDLANPNRYETIISEAGPGGGILAAASRTVRQREPLSDAQTVGASVTALTFLPFVLWIAQRAADEDLAGIAFCARDGALALELFNELPSELRGSSSAVYLEGNRKTWPWAALPPLGYDSWAELVLDNPGSTMRRRLHTSPLSASLRATGLELTDLPTSCPIASRDLALPLPAEAVHEWLEMFADPAVRETLSTRALPWHQATERYLADKGLDNGKWGLIDIGWLGESAAFASAAITQASGETPQVMHFGGHGTSLPIERITRIERFAFDGVDIAVPFTGVASAVEHLTASGRPSLVEFGPAAPPEPQPLVMSEPNTDIDTPMRREIWSAALAVAHELGSLDSRMLAHLAGLPVGGSEATAVLSTLWENPTLDEALCVGPMLYQSDFGDPEHQPAGRPYKLSSMMNQSGTTLRIWRPASLRMTRAPLRYALVTGSSIATFMKERG